MNSKRIISIVSPVSAGKTFIAVNLSAVIVQLNSIALVDLDFNERAIHTWMNIPSGARQLKALLTDKDQELVNVSGLTVYTADPCINIEPEWVAEDFIKKIRSEIIIIDMPREMNELHRRVLTQSNLAVWIGDPDYHHLLKIRGVIDKEPFLIINKHKELNAPLDYKELFGVEPEKLPVFEGVYDSILTGDPLVRSDVQARKLFERLYQKMKLKLK